VVCAYAHENKKPPRGEAWRLIVEMLLPLLGLAQL
jgi:hypothetical protein